MVDGRRWRATDPAIPDGLRTELVRELTAARRAVGAAGRAHDAAGEAAARARVQDAKLALGERGRPWWEPHDEAAAKVRLAAAVRALLRHRSPDATICPSDAARVAGGADWRRLLDLARATVLALASDGAVVVRQRGAAVEEPAAARGPIRVGRGPAFPS